MALMRMLLTATSSRQPRNAASVGRIYGTVAAKTEVQAINLPLRRRVYLYDNTGELLSTVLSRSSDGAYEFCFLKMGSEFTVLTRDFVKQFAPVCMDGLMPELKR